jgi:hypothetical protein
MKKENTEKTAKKVYWQWIKGDDSGNVVTIKNTDDQWINFNEGGRLAKDLKDEFIQPIEEDIANEFLNKPKPTNPLTKQSKPEQPIKESSPIRLLLDKQKKLDKVPLGLSFKVNVPKTEIVSILESSFDPTELNSELENFIEDQIDTKEIIQTLKDSVKILIQERYNKV